MSLSRVKTWIAGEVLTASDLNAEFNNVLNNSASLVFPVSGNITWQSGTSTTATLDHANTADRTYTFPDASTTLVGADTTQTLTGKTINGGTFSGTIAGTPTFGGSLVTITNALATGACYTATGNTASTNTATPVTIFAATSGLYIVTVFIADAGAANYTAYAFVVADGTNARIVSNDGIALTLTLSGTNVQATQTSGSAQVIAYRYLRIA